MATERFQYKDGITSTAGENTQRHYYDRAGIEAANAKAIYAQFADRKSMPTKLGKTYKISRWQNIYDRDLQSAEFAKKGFLSSRSLEDVTKGLTDALLPEGAGRQNLVNFHKITLETDFARFGQMIEYTDEVDLFSEDYIQTRYREELGDLANRHFEDLIQRDMLGTNNVMYSGFGTSLVTMGTGIAPDASLDDNWRVSYDLIRKCAAKLTRNRAMKNTSIVVGSTKVDTRTVNKAYYAIVGPQVRMDLEVCVWNKSGVAEKAFVPAYKYADAANLAQGEIGAMHDVRFIESESALVYEGKGAEVPANYTGTLSKTEVNGKEHFDVFPILFPTQGSFATVGLKGQGKIKFHAKGPGDVDLTNPYGTVGFFSYNIWYAGIILKEEALLKCLVLATQA